MRVGGVRRTRDELIAFQGGGDSGNYGKTWLFCGAFMAGTVCGLVAFHCVSSPEVVTRFAPIPGAFWGGFGWKPVKKGSCPRFKSCF